MVINEKRYTIAEYDAFAASHPDALFELVNGRIVEKVVGRKHGKIVLKIGSKLVAWCEENKIEGHYGTEVHHRIENDESHKLMPDVSFSFGAEDDDVEVVVGMPDFAVEVKSPGNSYAELREKAEIYIANGSRLVWLVYPTRSIVEVYFADATSELFDKDQKLSGGDVLPNFKMTVQEIFA